MNDPKSWLRKNPQVRTIRVAASDLNGQMRGKRVPTRFADKVVEEGTRFPLSVMNLDIWGEDIDDSPLVFESGDRDGVLRPTERGFVPMPWLEAPTALLPIWMYLEDGRPFEADPRHALANVLKRYKARGLTPMVAVELEFFLIDDSGKSLQVPLSPRSNKRRKAAEVMSIRALDAFDVFFTDLYDACEDMDIPDQDTTELQSRRSWPMYICRAAAINAHVTTDTEASSNPATPGAAVDGLFRAYEYLNWAISVTVVAASPTEILAFAVKSGYRAILAGLGRDT